MVTSTAPRPGARPLLATVITAAAAAVPAVVPATPASAADRGDFAPVPLPFFWPNNNLYDVAAASPGSVWIAGPKYGADNATSTYVAHFTGSRFTQVPLPPGTVHADLQARASGVWLTTATGVFRRAGGAWTRVTAVPEMEQDAVHVRADDDIWALGTASDGDPALVARHWDGRSWRSVPVEQPPGDGAGFTDVLALSPTDAWAIGYTSPGAAGAPLLMHWDGTAWTSAAPPAGLDILSEIAEGADGELWIVGHATDTPAAPGLLRYGGGTWERVPAAAVPNRRGFHATALAAVPGTGALWTLGTAGIGGPVVLTDG